MLIPFDLKQVEKVIEIDRTIEHFVLFIVVNKISKSNIPLTLPIIFGKIHLQTILTPEILPFHIIFQRYRDRLQVDMCVITHIFHFETSLFLEIIISV